MKSIQFDSGMQTYRVNGRGVLRFNPGDPNVYTRFLEAVQKLQDLERSLSLPIEEEDRAQALVQRMTQADKEMKTLLSWVFGSHNDFDALLEGVNLLAVTGNGERVVTNLLAALEPVLVEGAKLCAGEKVQEARNQAQARRSGQ